ncbi:hypothetical protein ABZT47_34700 [Sphaerisporangium sp. NPDC005289]|uniref:hypothetical protein n=1 Tax=Sphaerisporangium sp. NPDC005289 TaxID=3155247 RepID=UPI0033B5866F
MTAARSTVVTVTNATGQVLGKAWQDLPHGIWSGGIEPAWTIGPGETVSWRTESNGVLTGTEGRVGYHIGDAGPIAELHWDNPYGGSNSYDEVCPPGWAMLRGGGAGATTTVTWLLEPAQWHLTPFRPSTHGFRFPNSWPAGTTDTTIDLGLARLPIGDASNGLCGGMVYAALDYYMAGRSIPPQVVAPPGQGDPLFDFLVSRLFDSFDIPNLPARLFAIMEPAYPDTDGGVLEPVGLMSGRSAVMIREAWPNIKEWIDAGVPRPICLVKLKSLNPGDLGRNHQVLVWGYYVNGTGVALALYDPNDPRDDTCSLWFDAARTDVVVGVGTNPPDLGPVLCFLTTAYTPAQPPPGT